MIELLDQVFVRSRGAEGSLADRYPHILEGESTDVQILVARTAPGRIDAVTAVRTFELVDGSRAHRGAMVGFVATDPAFRGLGLASALVVRAREVALEAGASFCVLWTQTPDFYRRLGWSSHDRSLIGEARLDAPTVATVGEEVGGEAASWIECVRARHLRRRVVRAGDAYRVLPAPAERLELERSGVAADDAAYLLAGRAHELVVLYELVGAESRYRKLWERATSGSRHVLVNSEEGTRSAAWLKREAGVAFRPQSLAMWLTLPSGPGVTPPVESWQIPFLDRI